MPVLDVMLARPEERNWLGPYTALLDSGADFCILPAKLIRRLRPPLVRQATVYSHWRDARVAAIYTVDIRINDVVQPAVMVVSDPTGSEVLLGRNLLNRLDLRLNGFQQHTEILRI